VYFLNYLWRHHGFDLIASEFNGHIDIVVVSSTLGARIVGRCHDVTYMRQTLSELGYLQQDATPIDEDNQSTHILIATRAITSNTWISVSTFCAMLTKGDW
jgi:hypothetical protein